MAQAAWIHYILSMPHDAAPPHETEIAARIKAAEATCAQHGTQLTALRREVLELILQASAPVTAYQLLDQLKPIRKSAVPPTIYRALDFLLENRLIHKVERLNAFIPCTGADHEHAAVQFLICGKCSTVTEIDDDDIARALRTAAQNAGFHPGRALVELEGVCAACARLP